MAGKLVPSLEELKSLQVTSLSLEDLEFYRAVFHGLVEDFKAINAEIPGWMRGTIRQLDMQYSAKLTVAQEAELARLEARLKAKDMSDRTALEARIKELKAELNPPAPQQS